MKLTQPKLIRLGMVLAGVVVLYTLFTSYGGGKGSLLDRAEELGGLGPSGPMSQSGPSMGLPFSMGGNAASAEGMQGRTPASQQTYQETTLNSDELLPKGQMGASWAAVNPASGDDLKGQNFLQAGYHSNINVIGISQNWKLSMSGMLPTMDSLGAGDLSKYLPWSRTPGDMDKIPDTKFSVIFLTSGNPASRRMLAPITMGMRIRYIGFIVVIVNRTDRYTAKRTTAFNAARTVMLGWGTNIYHVSEPNNTLGSLYQNG